MKKLLNEKNIILTIIVVLAVLSRLIDHPSNFTPVFALALFSAVCFANEKLALFIPFSVMFISDLFIGLSSLNIVVYFTFGISYIIGYFFLKKNPGIVRIIMASVAVSTIFFIVSNFYVWALDPFSLYEKTYTGFIQCYTMALPFFRNSLLGDLFYSGVLFGAYALAEKFYFSKKEARETV